MRGHRGEHHAAWTAASEELLERLRGRMSLIQPAEERFQFVASALERLFKESGGRYPALATEELRHAFLDAFLRYDVIDELLEDPTVEDVIINSTERIYVHRTGEGLVRTDKQFKSQQELTLFVTKLVVFGGRTDVDPITDVELFDIRGRVNIVSSPFGPQITITRAKTQPFTILQLIETGMLTYELGGQLWMYVEGLGVRAANLIISGGPGTGKTTLLNALLSFIPRKDRVVTIEDTFELNTAFLENCSRLESCRRVDLADLVKNSLRMRPERILVGETRGIEARDLMTTMNLGKYCMSTLHASSARETILRLQNEPMNVPPVLINLIDAFIILRKLNTGNGVIRVVSELVETAGLEKQVVLLSAIWAYDHHQERVVERSPSSTYRDRLATESGRTPLQIMQETARRAKVLRLMQASERFTDISAVTEFCQLYAEAPEEALHELETTAEELDRR